MKKIEVHKNFFLGENKQWFPNEEFIVHLADPRCFIRFSVELAMFADYDEFYNKIAHIEWIDGRPKEYLVKETLINAYNFLAIEERILENDLENIDDEDF